MYTCVFIGESVASVGQRHSAISTEGHEEADTKISLHVEDALKAGHKSIVVSTKDSDVVVILMGLFPSLVALYPEADLWVGFGPRQHFRYYHINSLCEQWGDEISKALPYFHAFTGSDTTSQFFWHGKRMAWKAWMSFPHVTKAFLLAHEDPFATIDLLSPSFQLLERFVCILYDSSADSHSVNDMRRELFTAKGKSMEYLPPSQVHGTLCGLIWLMLFFIYSV